MRDTLVNDVKEPLTSVRDENMINIALVSNRSSNDVCSLILSESTFELVDAY
jgi:hypothetical protein